MRTTTINSYLYEEYADDDDLQSFVMAYNAATQTYIDWFNQTYLVYYPGLFGDLLNWVAKGLYGLERTQLSSPISPATGPLNTVELNVLALNDGVPSSETFYDITDDVFKRILTWDFYKADGKRFCIRWLKRRIMRFLVGTNGIDPQPFNMDGTPNVNFTVGAETTSAIGVVIASGTVTVSIDQTLLSLQTPIEPGILTLFQLAFEDGNLELPLEFAYVCNIITGFDALAIPNVLVGFGPQLNQAVGPTSIIALGGTGIYTYAWTWQSGGSGITIDDPSSVTTTFTASGLSWGTTVTGVALCTVTDTVSSLTALATCQVTITAALPAQILTESSAFILTTESGTPLVVEP